MFDDLIGEDTYHEDKEEFQKNYPHRIAIDRYEVGYSPAEIAAAAAGVGGGAAQSEKSERDQEHKLPPV